MLSIVSLANSSGLIGIGNPFAVGALELIDDQSIKLWYTRPTVNATLIGNYSISGPAVRNVVLAQYDTTMKVRLYLDEPLVPGQWTLSVSSFIQSDDVDVLSIPTNYQIVFDVAENLVVSDPAPELGTVASFIPKKLRNRRGTAEIVEAFQVGDDVVKSQARFAFDQYNICTATGNYLTIRAADSGIVKPEKLGISDNAFSQLAISLVNQRLTNSAILRVLESMYGIESVRAYVDSKAGPFRLFHEGWITFVVDGKTDLTYIVDISQFKNPMEVLAKELASSLNAFFDSNGSKAFANETSDGRVRIFSSTMGLQSKIAVSGGTLQPHLQLNEAVGGALVEEATADIDWEVTNPRPGIVRLQPSVWPYAFTNVRVGDYITITGENFPVALRDSWPVVNINYSYSGIVLVQWLEIESDYIVGL